MEVHRRDRGGGEDAAIGCVVVTGAGRGFCAGADIGGWGGGGKGDAVQHVEDAVEGGSRKCRGASRGKPIIAAINGVSVGVGLTMTMACDIRIAWQAHSARFEGGADAGCGSSRYAAGRGCRTRSSSRSPAASTEEALQRRLSTASSRRSADAGAMKLAEEIAANPHEAVWQAKRLLHVNATESDLRRVTTLECYSIRERQAEPDHREAVQAFMEKRPPVFNQ
jgi:2-(1,2-epoxy-1,2-dihydrophenyl)acetyl-CoA isomerase